MTLTELKERLDEAYSDDNHEARGIFLLGVLTWVSQRHRREYVHDLLMSRYDDVKSRALVRCFSEVAFYTPEKYKEAGVVGLLCDHLAPLRPDTIDYEKASFYFACGLGSVMATGLDVDE